MIEIMKSLIRKIGFRLFGTFQIEPLIARELQGIGTVLDAGCGRLSHLKGIKEKYLVGLDIYPPYIVESSRARIHQAYLLGDMRELPFKSAAFDCVVGIEILEHLNKTDGLLLLKEMERVARKKIILTTPNGFLPTYSGPQDNPSERHLSGWSYQEIKQLGFKIRGINGLKILWVVKGGQAVPRIRIPILSGILIVLSEFITYYFAALAFQFFFYKELDKTK